MQTSKSKWTKRIAGALSLLVFLAGMNAGLNYLLVEHTYADDYVADLEALKADGSNAKIVFLGSSRTFHSFVPEVFEEAFGIGTGALKGTSEEKEIALNAGSALQTPEGSYYALKDLLDRGFKPEYAIMGVSYNLLTTQLWAQADLILLDRMTPKNYLDYLLNAYEDENRYYAFSKLYRYRGNLTRERIKRNLEEKAARKAAAASGQPFVKDGEYYNGKGYVVNNASLPEQIASGALAEPEIDEFNAELIRSDRERYMTKLASLCREHDIKLIIVDTPTSGYMMDHVASYAEANAWWEDYALHYGLTYLNYNYIEHKDELFPDSLFMDYNHLNHDGAVKFSEICANEIKEIQWGF